VWKISTLGTYNTLKGFENLPYKIAAVNNLSDNDKDDFSSQPGQQENMKFFSTYSFQARSVFI
jgi:hypothetical protein